MEYLEKLANDNVYYTFDSDCIRKRSNMSKSHDAYKFDTSMYDPEKLLKNIPSQSPKLHKLLENIAKLDKKDMERDGHHYKHFIFCDLKSSSYGAKMLASALIATGKTLGYSAKRKDEVAKTSAQKTPKVRDDTPRPSDILSVKRLKKTPQLENIEEGDEENSMQGGSKTSSKKKEYLKMEFLDPKKLRETKFENFFLLSSVDVFDQSISVKDKKHILQSFNARPENVHGENIRFIIMDSGFKEGIDLFDIKYVHIFEPPVNNADKKQVIGRGTRTCGQKGLDFHPTRGWPLHVFIYDLEIPEPLQKQFLGSKTAMEVYLQSLNVDLRMAEFMSDMEKTIVYGSVDHDLNRKIHSFTIDEEGMEDDGDMLLGGGPKRKPVIRTKKLFVDPSKPALVIGSGSQEIVLPSGQKVIGMELRDMTFKKMREYIRDTFSHCSWKDVKMENQCGTSTASASNDGVIEYTPTQRFVQEYFTPQAPVKGMLLWHSVGTGKTCSAIAAATSSFVNQGYTILWVTRTTLKNDIWKNMFDQICNEQIRKMVRDGVELPKDHNKRMRLLSKAWKIRPMSYKQFSNLVSKENDYYRKLVDINGTQDPLRKTLLIIDEAHKLYGGGDLSSLERPDMKALHKALMNSYGTSGKDSARLLLMTATPITESPMEMNQLLNLCKPAMSQLPDEFDRFSLEYLDEVGKFTRAGRERFLDDIAGYVSYLNREKDARQFAQPKLHYVNVPLVKDVKEVEKMDRRYYKTLFLEDQEKLQKEIATENDKIEEEMRDLDKTRFYAIKDVCADYEGKVKKSCEKIANKNIKLLVNELKAITLHVKENVKELKRKLREKKQDRSDLLKLQKEYLKENVSEEEKKRFQDSSYYMLKYSCGKKNIENATLSDFANTHPEIEELDEKMRGHEENARALEERLKILTAAQKKKIKELKDLLRQDLSDLERNVVKSVLKDTMIANRKTMKETRKEVSKDTASNSKLLQELQKTRKKRLGKLRKIVKNTRKESKAAKKQEARNTKALRKTLRIQGELREEFQGDFMKNRIKSLQKDTDDEFSHMRDELQKEHDRKMEAKEIKETERAEKQRVREEAREEKEREKEKKRREKEREKEKKRREKEREKEKKSREKETRRKEKIRLKEAKKTKKNR
jgi:hypothetical protein